MPHGLSAFHPAEGPCLVFTAGRWYKSSQS
jgi:hypothetical protein